MDNYKIKFVRIDRLGLAAYFFGNRQATQEEIKEALLEFAHTLAYGEGKCEYAKKLLQEAQDKQDEILNRAKKGGRN